jgi:hypothetical protein
LKPNFETNVDNHIEFRALKEKKEGEKKEGEKKEGEKKEGEKKE